jgi:undecaprenyl-diphosphatase
VEATRSGSSRGVRTLVAAAAANAALFAATTVVVMLVPGAWGLDRIVAGIAAESRSPALDLLARTLATVGDTAGTSAITLLTGLALAASRRLRGAVFVVATVASGALASTALKTAVERPRPDGAYIASVPASASFPSGHVVAAACLAGALAALVLAAPSASRGVKAIALTASTAWVVTMAASRVYLGVHYASDAIGGALLGAAVVCASAAAYIARGSGRCDGAVGSVMPPARRA